MFLFNPFSYSSLKAGVDNVGNFFFSSKTALKKDLKLNLENLDPNWITGFSDAESCFSIIISKRTNYSWRVKASFEINLHIKDINILYQIQKFFRVGSVTSRINKNIGWLPVGSRILDYFLKNTSRALPSVIQIADVRDSTFDGSKGVSKF